MDGTRDVLVEEPYPQVDVRDHQAHRAAARGGGHHPVGVDPVGTAVPDEGMPVGHPDCHRVHVDRVAVRRLHQLVLRPLLEGEAADHRDELRNLDLRVGDARLEDVVGVVECHRAGPRARRHLVPRRAAGQEVDRLVGLRAADVEGIVHPIHLHRDVLEGDIEEAGHAHQRRAGGGYLHREVVRRVVAAHVAVQGVFQQDRLKERQAHVDPGEGDPDRAGAVAGQGARVARPVGTAQADKDVHVGGANGHHVHDLLAAVGRGDRGPRPFREGEGTADVDELGDLQRALGDGGLFDRLVRGQLYRCASGRHGQAAAGEEREVDGGAVQADGVVGQVHRHRDRLGGQRKQRAQPNDGAGGRGQLEGKVTVEVRKGRRQEKPQRHVHTLKRQAHGIAGCARAVVEPIWPTQTDEYVDVGHPDQHRVHGRGYPADADVDHLEGDREGALEIDELGDRHAAADRGPVGQVEVRGVQGLPEDIRVRRGGRREDQAVARDRRHRELHPGRRLADLEISAVAGRTEQARRRGKAAGQRVRADDVEGRAYRRGVTAFQDDLQLPVERSRARDGHLAIAGPAGDVDFHQACAVEAQGAQGNCSAGRHRIAAPAGGMLGSGRPGGDIDPQGGLAGQPGGVRRADRDSAHARRGGETIGAVGVRVGDLAERLLVGGRAGGA